MIYFHCKFKASPRQKLTGIWNYCNFNESILDYENGNENSTLNRYSTCQ